MRPKRAQAPATAELVELLIHGPWRVGKDLLTMPADAELRRAWQAHETAIRAEAKRRGVEQPWIVDRLLFVDLIDGVR